MDIDIKKVEELFFSDEFEKLNAYSREFDIFKVMRIRNKELIHSNILASLLNPSESHGMGYTFINQFIRSLKHTHLLDTKALPLPLSIIISAQDSPVKIHRELDHIDLIMDFKEAKLVIAIENKIWAEEQNNQIGLYQKKLIDRYQNYNRALVFLTPYGKEPESANPESSVPIYCMAHSNISKICDISKKNANKSAFEFFNQFSNHLERYMSGKSEAKELCWQLFNKHKEAYTYIAKYYDECVARTIEDKFNEIGNKIQTDSMFSAWHGKFEIKREMKITGKQIVNLDLDIRINDWPEGIWIKVYKHIGPAVFPYVKQGKISLIKKYLNKNPEPSKYWKDYFYFSKLADIDTNRYVLENDVNEFGDDEINSVLNKVKQHLEEIETIVKA